MLHDTKKWVHALGAFMSVAGAVLTAIAVFRKDDLMLVWSISAALLGIILFTSTFDIVISKE